MRKLKKFFSKKFFKKISRLFGPGVITGGADNDPAGIATYATAGALFRYSLLWVLAISTPLLIIVQGMAAKLALAKRKGLASIIAETYGRKIAIAAILLLAIANIATIAADIAGIAEVLALLTGVEWRIFVIPLALLITYFIIFKQYKTIRNFLLTLTFLLVLYIGSAILANPSWSDVALGFIPKLNFSTSFIAAVIAVIGTTISPYMLFWQASEELEEHKRYISPKEVKVDTALGMLWSNMVAAFIIIASGATIYGIQNITASDASLALAPIAGSLASLLFALGIIVSGLLSLPVLAASTAFAFAEVFGFKEGLSKKPSRAKGFYGMFALCMVIGSILAFLPVEPFEFLFLTQIFDGFLTPFMLALLLLLCNNRSIVGSEKNSLLENIFVILLILLLLAFNAMFLHDVLF